MGNKNKGLKRHGEEGINQFAHKVNLDQVAGEAGRWSILVGNTEDESDLTNEATLSLNALETRNAVGMPFDDECSVTDSSLVIIDRLHKGER